MSLVAIMLAQGWGVGRVMYRGRVSGHMLLPPYWTDRPVARLSEPRGRRLWEALNTVRVLP